MDARRAVVAGGVGLATFILVTVLVTEVVSVWNELSLFLGLPLGLLAGCGATAMTYARVRSASGDDAFRVAAAVASFGYAVLAFWLVRYSVASTRSVLSVPTVSALAVVAAVATYAGLGR